MSKEIMSMLRKEYTMRLLEALTETDLLDTRVESVWVGGEMVFLAEPGGHSVEPGSH